LKELENNLELDDVININVIQGIVGRLEILQKKFTIPENLAIVIWDRGHIIGL